MVEDLHSHTYYSFCGKDSPELVAETAIEGGIELLGICDHTYGVGLKGSTDEVCYQRCIDRYFGHISLLRDFYKDKIRILRGIEVCTIDRGATLLPENVDISMFDYCLVEHLTEPDTMMTDLFSFAKRCGCKTVGVAHTDIPGYLKSRGLDPAEFFGRMAEENIFWEMNVNHDSVHGYRKHQYVSDFFEDDALVEIVRKSGVALSVGFDGHAVEEYKAARVKAACEKIEGLGIPLAFA